jgi:hypothetical protein
MLVGEQIFCAATSGPSDGSGKTAERRPRIAAKGEVFGAPRWSGLPKGRWSGKLPIAVMVGDGSDVGTMRR